MEAEIHIFCILSLFSIILDNIETVERKFLAIYYSIKKSIKWIRKNWKSKEHRRFWLIFLVNLGIKEFVDLVLTPFFMIEVGPFFSFILTTIIYLFIGIKSLRMYDSRKTDIFWFQELRIAQKNHEQIETKNYLIKFVLKKNRKNKFFLGLLLSFKNLALPIIYFRNEEDEFNGFKGKNIKLYFTCYLLITNLSWNLMIFLGISFWGIIWNFIKIIFS